MARTALDWNEFLCARRVSTRRDAQECLLVRHALACPLARSRGPCRRLRPARVAVDPNSPHAREFPGSRVLRCAAWPLAMTVMSYRFECFVDASPAGRDVCVPPPHARHFARIHPREI